MALAQQEGTNMDIQEYIEVLVGKLEENSQKIESSNGNPNVWDVLEVVKLSSFNDGLEFAINTLIMFLREVEING